MTHESLPAANVSPDTTAGKDEAQKLRELLVNIRGSEESNVTFLRHLALNAQATYYYCDDPIRRSDIHKALKENISHFSTKSPEEQEVLFIDLLVSVDDEAQREAQKIREEMLGTHAQVVLATAPEILGAVDPDVEPATLMLPVTPEDNLEATYAQPATEFDTPVSISLGEMLHRPYSIAKKIGLKTLERAGIYRSVE